jgi:hypothetical protein
MNEDGREPSYLHDNVGNVTQRRNNNLGLTENFNDDAVNRLAFGARRNPQARSGQPTYGDQTPTASIFLPFPALGEGLAKTSRLNTQDPRLVTGHAFAAMLILRT